MPAQLLNGKALANQIYQKMAEKIATWQLKGWAPPSLATILVGSDPASSIYVNSKHQACQSVGIKSVHYALPDSISQSELIELIQGLNANPAINGILVQLPLPAHINKANVLEQISPLKDVDGFHPYNLGRLAQRLPVLRPCTPYGVMTLLNSIHTSYPGKDAVIIGASTIVGRPMALELLMAGCTITVCHRSTQSLAAHVLRADIVISATGHPGLVRGEWIKPGAIVIDVGITRLADGSIVGDVAFEEASEKAAWITPVPGGVGPMTVAMLLTNTLTAAALQQNALKGAGTNN